MRKNGWHSVKVGKFWKILRKNGEKPPLKRRGKVVSVGNGMQQVGIMGCDLRNKGVRFEKYGGNGGRVWKRIGQMKHMASFLSVAHFVPSSRP